MQTIIIESNQITLPFEVVNKLKGKKVQFEEYKDGFLLKPIHYPKDAIRQKSKLSNLKRRMLIKGDSDELLNIKVWEWDETKNI